MPKLSEINPSSTPPLTSDRIVGVSGGQDFTWTIAQIGTVIGGGFPPGGTTGQLQYNSSGVFGGVPTVSGDGTLSTATGVLTVTKTGGVPFSASATTDTTNAANISTGTIPAARLPAATSSVAGAVKPDNTTITVSGGVLSATGGGVSSVTNVDGTLVISPTTGAVVASAPKATSGAFGIVKPDNSTITVSGGVISASAGLVGGEVDLAATYGLVGDGITDNTTAFQAMASGANNIKIVSPTYGTVTSVTLSNSGGNLLVTSSLSHNMRVGDPLIFGGTLTGTGLTAGTIYYTAFAGMTGTAFQVVSSDPWVLFASGTTGGPYPASVAFTGAGASVKVQTVNRDWKNLRLPPGTYAYTGSNPIYFGGLRRWRLLAEGATIIGAHGVQFNPGSYPGFNTGFFLPATEAAKVNPITPGAFQITLKNAGDAAKFVLGPYKRGQMQEVEETVIRSAEAVESILAEGVEKSMTVYNRRAQGLNEEEE